MLAQKVLKWDTRGYRHHPQLDRFELKKDPIAAIGGYLHYIHKESLQRGYNFNRDKIDNIKSRIRINLNMGQLIFEWRHLLIKLKSRDRPLYLKVRAIEELDVHPLFRVVKGNIADWEVIK